MDDAMLVLCGVVALQVLQTIQTAIVGRRVERSMRPPPLPRLPTPPPPPPTNTTPRPAHDYCTCGHDRVHHAQNAGECMLCDCSQWRRR